MENDILYRLATKEDREAILQFLREHYYPYEPLNCFIEPKGQQEKYDEDSTISSLDTTRNDFCLLCVKGNQIIGCCVCVAKNPDQQQTLLEEASKMPGTKFAKILTMLAKIEKDSNVYKKYNITKVMHLNDLAVHTDFRGHGIGLQLYDKSIQIAKVLGYPLFTSDCTSIYSARMSDLLGMECVNVLKMEEYRAPGSDEQVLFPTENQKYIKTYAKLLG